MITRLRGFLLEKKELLIVLDVHGVGYELEVPFLTFRALPEIGAELALFTHHLVREDAQILYGFATLEERGLFRQLIRVNGVGPKLAMGILSQLSAGEFARLILDENISALTKVPGIGRKTAERLVVELRGKLVGLSQTPTAPRPTDASEEATRALISLGFKPQEASRLVLCVEAPGLDSEAMIRTALKRTVKRSDR